MNKANKKTLVEILSFSLRENDEKSDAKLETLIESIALVCVIILYTFWVKI